MRDCEHLPSRRRHKERYGGGHERRASLRRGTPPGRGGAPAASVVVGALDVIARHHGRLSRRECSARRHKLKTNHRRHERASLLPSRRLYFSPEREWIAWQCSFIPEGARAKFGL